MVEVFVVALLPLLYLGVILSLPISPVFSTCCSWSFFCILSSWDFLNSLLTGFGIGSNLLVLVKAVRAGGGVGEVPLVTTDTNNISSLDDSVVLLEVEFSAPWLSSFSSLVPFVLLPFVWFAVPFLVVPFVWSSVPFLHVSLVLWICFKVLGMSSRADGGMGFAGLRNFSEAT